MVDANTLPVYSPFVDEKQSMPESAPPAPVPSDVEVVQLARRRKRSRIGRFLFSSAMIYMVVKYFSGDPSVEGTAFGCTSRPEFPTLMSSASGWHDEGVDAVCSLEAGSWKTEGPFSGHGPQDVYSAQLDFDMSPSSFGYFVEAAESLAHLTRSGELSGNIAFVPSSSDEASNLTVAVHVVYSNPAILNQLRVCNVQAGDETGVVLGARRSRHGLYADPMFNIGIRVTVPKEGLAAQVKTKLEGFAHDVRSDIVLNSLDIVTDKSVLFQRGSSIGDVSVKTDNHPITGFFNVSAGLKLVTSNAPIVVGVEAYHTSHWPSTIRLATSNAVLNATLALKNTTEIGRFRVFAQTYNAPVNVTLAESPINGAIWVEAKTRNAEALLELDPAFEGSFATHTTNADPTVARKEDVKDPVGDERERFVETRYVSPRAVAGSVAWGAPLGNRRKSAAGVGTTNARATIVL